MDQQQLLPKAERCLPGACLGNKALSEAARRYKKPVG